MVDQEETKAKRTSRMRKISSYQGTGGIRDVFQETRRPFQLGEDFKCSSQTGYKYLRLKSSGSTKAVDCGGLKWPKETKANTKTHQ